MHPVSCPNTHHDVTDLGNCEMAKTHKLEYLDIEDQPELWYSYKEVCVAICSSKYDNKHPSKMRNKRQSSYFFISVIFPVWDPF